MIPRLPTAGPRAAVLTGALVLARLLVLVRLVAPADVGAFAAAAALVALAASLTVAPATPGDDAGWSAGLLRAGAAAVLLARLAGPLAALCGVPRAANVLRALALLPRNNFV